MYGYYPWTTPDWGGDYPAWADLYRNVSGSAAFVGDPSVLGDLGRAADEQSHAIHYYGKLIELAPDEEDRSIITEIRQDEIGHFNLFSSLYTHFSGRRPPLTPGPEPSSLEEGVKFAIRDELNTVDFYNAAADRARDAYVQAAFRRSALDEQQHAGWFLYMWLKLVRASH